MEAAAIPDVIGIAVSMASGVNANYGTMTKPLHAGHAARNGMAAAMLGKAGLSANHAALEGRGGFFATFARGIPWNAEPFDDLGRSYDLAEVGIRPKRYPCGGVIHSGIDAALQICDGSSGPRSPTSLLSRPASRNTPRAAPARSIRPTWRRRSSICNMSWPLRS